MNREYSPLNFNYPQKYNIKRQTNLLHNQMNIITNLIVDFDYVPMSD